MVVFLLNCIKFLVALIRSRDFQLSASCCFIRQVSLIPGSGRSCICRTDVVYNSVQPIYDEKFSL